MEWFRFHQVDFRVRNPLEFMFTIYYSTSPNHIQYWFKLTVVSAIHTTYLFFRTQYLTELCLSSIYVTIKQTNALII